MMKSLLIVDDEATTREGLQEALADIYDVYVASGADEAFDLMKQIDFDVVLTDLRMVGKSGLKVIDKSLKLPNKPVVIMMTAYGNVETAVEAMRRGAADFLQKPLNLDKLEIVIERALRNRNLEAENVTLKARLDEKFSPQGFVGNSPQMKSLLEQISTVAPSRASILVEGPTGTGKELVANAIHQASDRKDKPFIAVHCAALSANLLESELFGHQKGAFTGATENRDGRFAAADGGTLFLDEIGEIDASTQVKLLRFLESRSFERVGSNTPVQVDVRLVVATNRDLEAMVQKGDFREDLYYRLNVVKLTMPALKERTGDISLLLEHYLDIFAKENSVGVPTITAAVMKILQDYDWPGNIRELRNLCERWVVVKRGGEVTPDDLEPRFFQKGSAGADTLKVSDNEKELYRKALATARGNKTKAAELMGVSRRTLHRKIQQWGLV